MKLSLTNDGRDPVRVDVLNVTITDAFVGPLIVKSDNPRLAIGVCDRDGGFDVQVAVDGEIVESVHLPSSGAGPALASLSATEPVDGGAWWDSTDARVWAWKFRQSFIVSHADGTSVDDIEGLMIAWFANAIETGRRHHPAQIALDHAAVAEAINAIEYPPEQQR